MLLTLFESLGWLMSPSNIFRFASGGIIARGVLAGCGGCGRLGDSFSNYARPVVLRQSLCLVCLWTTWTLTDCFAQVEVVMEH